MDINLETMYNQMTDEQLQRTVDNLLMQVKIIGEILHKRGCQ